jgi:hypothetical protein
LALFYHNKNLEKYLHFKKKNYLYNVKYKVSIAPIFKKQQSRLAKKYPSLDSDVIAFIEEIKENPNQGSSLGSGLYKVRMQIASKSKGKSGGARIITCVKIVEKQVILAAIYDKSEQDTMTAKELIKLLNQIQ